MSTLVRAWRAFLDAITEAQALLAARGEAGAIQDLLQHARELLEIIADEISLNGVSLPEWARNGLEHLREKLIAVESELVTKH